MSNAPETQSNAEPRWRRLPGERPGQIMQAALEVFGERGLSASRLEDIAKRAGLSKGTIYLYFPNKEELFREMVRHTVVSQIEQREQLISAASGSATELLVLFMRDYWKFIRSAQFAPLFRLIHAEIQNFPDLASFYAQEVVARGHRLMAGIIDRGIESRRIPRHGPDGRRAHAGQHLRDARPLVHAPRLFRIRRKQDGRTGTERNNRFLSPRHSAFRCAALRAENREIMNATFPRIIRIGAGLSLLVALLAFLVRAAEGQTPTEPKRLSLGDAARLAAAQTANVQNAQLRVLEAQARVNQSESALLPQVDADPELDESHDQQRDIRVQHSAGAGPEAASRSERSDPWPDQDLGLPRSGGAADLRSRGEAAGASGARRRRIGDGRRHDCCRSTRRRTRL